MDQTQPLNAPQQPMQQPPMQNQINKVNIRMVVIIGIVLLILVGSVMYILGTRSQQPNMSVMKTNVISNPISSPTIIITPVVKSNVDIKHIYIKTGITAPPNAQNASVIFRTAQGHYLFTSTQSQIKNLIYDGKVVVENQKIDSIQLSKNGEHYVYTLVGDNNTDLYVDGKKVTSYSPLITNPFVTDDGQHIVYVKSTPYGQTGESILMRDTVELLKADNGFINVFVSNDGQHYFAHLRGPQEQWNKFRLIYDGKEVYTGSDISDTMNISPNGLHYFFQTSSMKDQILYVDGKQVANSNPISFPQVTDGGHYAFSAFGLNNQTKIYIDKNIVNINLKASVTPFVTINQDATHNLVLDGVWYLDKKQIDLGENVGTNVEFENNILYVYHISN